MICTQCLKWLSSSLSLALLFIGTAIFLYFQTLWVCVNNFWQHYSLLYFIKSFIELFIHSRPSHSMIGLLLSSMLDSAGGVKDIHVFWLIVERAEAWKRTCSSWPLDSLASWILRQLPPNGQSSRGSGSAEICTRPQGPHTGQEMPLGG